MGGEKIRKCIKRFIAFILFLCVAWQVFVHTTYLFRSTGNQARQRLLAFNEEETDSLDVVFVGGSNVHAFWDSMLAWNKFGMATYGYAADAMSAYTYLPAIKKVKKSQPSAVIVVDVRKFLSKYEDNDVTLTAYRFFLDSLNYDIEGFSAMNHIASINNIKWKDAVLLYLDIIMYHSDRSILKDKSHWLLINNKIDLEELQTNLYKGTLIHPTHSFLKRPENDSEQTGEMSEKAESEYRELIEYCRDNEIKLLLTASPYEETEQANLEFNRMAEIAEEYNVDFKDFNHLYDEIGLDFSTDFIDINHTNILGMEKYTEYVADYLKDEFDLPDHRGDERYSEWDKLYEEYKIKKEGAIKDTWKRIEDKIQVIEIEKIMRETIDPEKWLNMANNPSMTVLAIKSGNITNPKSPVSAYYLERYGITEDILSQDKRFMSVYGGGKLIKSGLEENYGGQIKISSGGHDLSYNIGFENGPHITIAEQDYYSDIDGIQIVVIDNNTLEVADSVVLNVSEDGSLKLRHLPYIS